MDMPAISIKLLFFLRAGRRSGNGLKTYRYFDEEENEIKGEERDRLAEVDVKKTPICIASDGIYLVEDPGGVHGFYEMLKTLAGDDLEEKARTKEWAKGLGWTGRISEPKNTLNLTKMRLWGIFYKKIMRFWG